MTLAITLTLTTAPFHYPVPNPHQVPRSSKMELLEAESFVLQSFDTATGLKFFLTADPESKHLDQVCGRYRGG